MRHQMLARAAVVTALAGILVIPVAAPASAAEATGCAGGAVSRNAQGAEIDHVTAPGPGGTASNPFKVDLDGTVTWEGATNAVIKNGTWKVSIGGVPVSGSYPNEEGKRTAGGTENLGERIPSFIAAFFRGNLKMEVKADISGAGGSCTATVWIQSVGSNAALSPIAITGMAASVAGLLLLLWMFLGTTKVAAAVPASYTYLPPPPGGPPPPPPPGGFGTGV